MNKQIKLFRVLCREFVYSQVQLPLWLGSGQFAVQFTPLSGRRRERTNLCWFWLVSCCSFFFLRKIDGVEHTHAYVRNVTYFSINKPLVVWLWCDNGALNVLVEGHMHMGCCQHLLGPFSMTVKGFFDSVWANEREKMKLHRSIRTLL